MTKKLIGRTIAAAALAAGLAASLAGCASQAEKPEAPTTSEKPAAESALSGTVTVYAAASLEPAFDEISGWFTEEHPDVSFEFSYDGSSALAKQIISGAPVDVFASADEANMEKVVTEGLIDGTPTNFATSELMIAVAPGNPLGITSLADLANGPVTVVCAAEVPCGAASQKLLARDGVALTPASEEQNVTAVLTKVEAGEADAGLVYRSDVLRAGDKVEGIAIPAAEEAAGAYLAAPVKGTKSLELSQAFTEYLLAEKSQKLFVELGFGAPNAK